MTVTIRPERPADWRETEILTRDAFWDVYKPGCDEHLIVHKLRGLPVFVPELDLVACDGDRIVGHVMCTKARILGTKGEIHEALCLGPISVRPELQRNGIGGRLIRESLECARDLGFRGIFLMGNPAYYTRFGFKRADEFGVLAPDGQGHDYFMGQELAPGRLEGVTGTFCEDEGFRCNPEELDAFEKLFPYREKHVTPTQLWH